ncbi:hypothetical protein BVRB_4g094500 [Beta vulgaris subsp. vulgaris]|uniref:Uncharacterized protein n=1 Tax=Beta vulgaris subsp. vulgaris TaxID=3555 RepID=A0A0J8E4Y8_BETVV|nr:hypothetical protein BVRB_4g094500 [Beta vulgaris subsp. vulgaris]
MYRFTNITQKLQTSYTKTLKKKVLNQNIHSIHKLQYIII